MASEICDFFDQYEIILQNSPIDIQTSICFPTSPDYDLPEILINAYNKTYTELLICIYDQEDEKIDFTAQDIGRWLLSKLPVSFECHDDARTYAEEYCSKVDAYMNNKIREYESLKE